VDLISNSKFQGAPKKFKSRLTTDYVGGHSHQIVISMLAILHLREHHFFSMSPSGTVVASVYERTHAHTATIIGTHSHERICCEGNMECHILRPSMIFRLQSTTKGFNNELITH
jgi:hypothetical protein